MLQIKVFSYYWECRVTCSSDIVSYDTIPSMARVLSRDKRSESFLQLSAWEVIWSAEVKNRSITLGERPNNSLTQEVLKYIRQSRVHPARTIALFNHILKFIQKLKSNQKPK